METVVEFLLEYYIWILAVLVILLITVIGFLVDTNKKKKLRNKVEENESNNNVGENMVNQYPDFNNENLNMDINQNNMMSNNFNMEGNLNNNMMNNNLNMESNLNTNMINQPSNIYNDQNINQIQNMNAQMNNFNNSIQSQGNNDTFFVPASEQTPTFAPREVSIPTPAPVEPTPIMNNNVETVNGWDNVPSQPATMVMPNVTPAVEPMLNVNNNVENSNQGIMQTPIVEPAISPVVEPVPTVEPTVMPNVTPVVEPTPVASTINAAPVAVDMPNIVPTNSNIEVNVPVQPVNLAMNSMVNETSVPNIGQMNTFEPTQNLQNNINMGPTPVVTNTPIAQSVNQPEQIGQPINSTLVGGANFIVGNPNNNMTGNNGNL